MEKQLLINFSFSFRFNNINDRIHAHRLESMVEHYTIKNVEMRYHQHAYFHIKETVYIFIYVHWLRYTVICSLLVII
jgi:hypothetical protein